MFDKVNPGETKQYQDKAASIKNLTVNNEMNLNNLATPSSSSNPSVVRTANDAITYIHTKLYLNHASLNSRWKAGFHEGREITYLQEVNYIQEIQNITK